MLNRFRRRSVFFVVFFIQIILFSTYTVIYYRSTQSDEPINTGVRTTISMSPKNLPAQSLEKISRAFSNEHYKQSENRTNSSSIYPPSFEDLQQLNISFVKDTDTKKSIVQCPILPSNLVGRVQADLFSYELEEIEEHLANLSIKHGGHWTPPECTARHRVAIIIPYRNRDMQLRIFLHFMHPFLQKQQLDYRIYLIEPVANDTFNRALLFNIGYREATKHYAWECMIFHDVDLIPEDDRNVYSCPPEPRHMSVAVNTMNYQLPYRTIFGGVSALTVEQFKSVNGFSNQYFGWGGEDDDMAARILTKYRITRYPAEIARYKMLRHRPDTPNQSRFKTLELSSQLRSIDGLSNLQYKLVETIEEKLYTLIRVTYNQTAIRSNVAHIKKKAAKAKRHKT